MEKVDFPLFEPMGPPCEHPGCKGVLWDNISFKRGLFFRKCTKCEREFHHVTLKEKSAWAVRTIHRALGGIKSD